MKKLLLWSAIFASTAQPLTASCACDSCPIDPSSPKPEHQLNLYMNLDWVDLNQVRIESNRATVGEREEDHNEVKTLNQVLTLGAAYQLTPHWDIFAEIPYVSRVHEHIHLDDGMSESWSMNAFGDLKIGAGYGHEFQLLHPQGKTYVRAAVKLPTGATDQTNSDGEKADVPVQPGSGSTDLEFSATYSQPLFKWTNCNALVSVVPLQLSSFVKLPGEGTEGYRNGKVLTLGADLSFALSEGLTEQIGLLGKLQGTASPGQTDEVSQNTGGTYLYLTSKTEVALWDTDHRWHLGIYLPLYQRVNGIQLSADWMLRTGLSWSLQI